MAKQRVQDHTATNTEKEDEHRRRTRRAVQVIHYAAKALQLWPSLAQVAERAGLRRLPRKVKENSRQDVPRR